MVSLFKILQTLGKMNQCQLFCEFNCTHAEDNKKYVSKKLHVFHALITQINQKVNFDAISNAIMFLTLRVKVWTMYSYKRPCILELWR